MTLERASRLFLGRLPESMDDFNALGARLGKAVNRKAYTGYYIEYVMSGDQPFSAPLQEAVKALVHEILAEPPEVVTKEVAVRVPVGTHVPEGTLVLADARTCICGESFIPKTWNQINHTKACAKMRAQIRRQQHG